MNQVKNGFATSVTNKLLIMKFFSEFILIYPLVTIMYGQYGHVSAAGIGIILAVGLALSVIFEIPTGVIADKIPRKYVLLFSIICKILALLTWIMFPFFSGYIVAATLFALSSALESGTLQAYLYGALGTDNKKGFGKFWAKVNAMAMISYTIAYVFAAIVGVHYTLLIALSIIPCLIALSVCLSLPADKLRIENEVKPKIFASAVNHIKSSPALIKLIIGGVVIVALAQVMIEYVTLYYYQVGVVVRLVPIVMAIGNILGAALFWWFHRWEDALNRYKILILLFFSMLFIISFQGGVAFQVIGILLLTRVLRLLQIQYESNIQHLANDEARATISSISSFVSSFIAAIAMVAIGFFAVDNIVVRPIRITILLGITVYIVLQLLIGRQKINASVAKN